MLKKELEKIVGGLSKPSKMPGPAYNLPAYKCITGQKLAKVPGSVCHGCYALKGRYRFNNVKSAMERRLEALKHPHNTFICIEHLGSGNVKLFRGSQILELVACGLELEACCLGLTLVACCLNRLALEAWRLALVA